MLISSHLFAHHARFSRQPQAPERFVYVHTPARYVWVPGVDARGAHPLAKSLAPYYRRLDKKRAGEPNAHFAANSQFIKKRIEDAWAQEARVIYPPVDVTAIQDVEEWDSKLTLDELTLVNSLPSEFVLGASRFIPYKQLDLVIQAADIAKVPAVIAGSGPEEARLRELAAEASIPVFFVIEPRTELLYSLFQRAAAYIFPPVEDFGIMPVEAMAAGATVIANAVGGAAETVIHGSTGWQVHDMNPTTLARAISEMAALDPVGIRSHARQFSRERFVAEIQDWIIDDGRKQ